MGSEGTTALAGPHTARLRASSVAAMAVAAAHPVTWLAAADSRVRQVATMAAAVQRAAGHRLLPGGCCWGDKWEGPLLSLLPLLHPLLPLLLPLLLLLLWAFNPAKEGAAKRGVQATTRA